MVLHVGDKVRLADMSSYFAYWKAAGATSLLKRYLALKAANTTGVVVAIPKIKGWSDQVKVRVDGGKGRLKTAQRFDEKFWEKI